MRPREFFAGMMGVLGLFLAMAVVGFCWWGRGKTPELRREPQGAKERAEEMMNALCRGDFEAAGQIIYGPADFGIHPQAATESEMRIWNAYVDSLSYEIPGDCYGTETGIRLGVRLRGLDIGSVTQGLKDRARALLQERVAQAANAGEIYDETNGFRRELVAEVLRDAVRDALTQDARVREQTIPLNLVYKEGQWWVLPGPELVQALSGV